MKKRLISIFIVCTVLASLTVISGTATEPQMENTSIKNILVPLALGFEEIETSTIVDILRRAEINVTIAGLEDGPIEGMHGMKIIPDININETSVDEFDAIVLPGGYPGFINLGEDERVLKIVREMDDQGKYIAAICGAPSVLSKAGILQGKNATIHPTIKDLLTDAQYIDERVVVDGKIITSQGPGTAMEFSLKLVEIWEGKDKAKAISEAVLAPQIPTATPTPTPAFGQYLQSQDC